MIKLIFNPYYDRGVWTPDPGKGLCVKEQKYVGPKGLISELCLRLGLPDLESPGHEVLYSWYASIKGILDCQDPFYKASFEIEPLAVAQRLLSWRDALVIYGWTPETDLPEDLSSNAKAILGELGELEVEFRKAGLVTFSDKVRTVFSEIPSSGIMRMELESVIPYDALEPLWQKLINLLEAEGWKVSFPAKGKELPENIELERFKDYVDACMWVASRDSRDELVICSDASPLDWSLRALGKPVSGSDASVSNHQIPHLFVDLMQLCRPKFEVRSIISYLSVHPHPLDQFKDDKGQTELRKELRAHFVRQCGFGYNEVSRSSFDGILGRYVTEGVSLSDIKAWLPFSDPKTTIDAGYVQYIAKNLGRWATDTAKVYSEEERKNDVIVEGMRQLAQTCSVFTRVMSLLGYDEARGADEPTSISDEDFTKVVEYAYRPQKAMLHRGEVGSISVTSSVDSITAPVNSAIWIAPAPSAAPYPYDFLSDSDVEKLHAVMDIPSRKSLLVQSRESEKASLSNVKKLTLVLCDKVGTEIPSKHQILVDKMRDKGDLGYTSVDESLLQHGKFRDPRTQQAEHNLGKNYFNGKFRDEISPSAMEKLLERPFDYVMTYMMGLWGEGGSSEAALLGNVAHYVFESIYKAAKDDEGVCTADKFEAVFNRDYDSIFDAAVLYCGLELNQPEKALVRKDIHYQLKDHAIPKFLGMMRDNGLVIIASEESVSFTITSPDGKTDLALKARIDLLLRDRERNYVIFDFKYTSGTSGRDKRAEQIMSGTDYQLMMYRALVESMVARGKKDPGIVKGVGFYMLATSELLSAYPFEGCEVLKAEKTYDQAMVEFFKAYEEMMDNLHAGILIEGEGMPKEEGGRDVQSFGENKILKGKLN